MIKLESRNKLHACRLSQPLSRLPLFWSPRGEGTGWMNKAPHSVAELPKRCRHTPRTASVDLFWGFCLPHFHDRAQGCSNTMSEAKKLLKSARESLQKKDYQDALDHCKAALKLDKSCYEAYVFVGKAAFHLKEYAQAEAAYTRATSLDASNSLAWQGLAELYTETGDWARTYQAYSTLVQLVSDPVKSSAFLCKAADAAYKAGMWMEAEMGYMALLDGVTHGPSRLDLLCRLADSQLAAEEALLTQQLVAAGCINPPDASDVDTMTKDKLEAEWGEAQLGGPASTTIREIMNLAPPSPLYSKYYDAYLHRLRMAARCAPAGSMERHSRRSDVLNFSLSAAQGRSGDGLEAGGCCTPVPYEAALAMLEVEGDVAGAVPDAAQANSPYSFQLISMEQVTKRLSHAFPWNASAAVHMALLLRRRATGIQPHPPSARVGVGVGPEGDADTVTDMAEGASKLPPEHCKRMQIGSRRRRLIRLLLSGLKRGAPSAAGWLAASELLVEEGAGQAALDAAKQGLAYLAAREMLGHQSLTQADLLLKLVAGKAMAAMVGVPVSGPAGYTLDILAAVHATAAANESKLPPLLERRVLRSGAGGVGVVTGEEGARLAGEAQAWLGWVLLGGRVGGGPAPFARVAGSAAAADITQQATRCLAQLSLILGDVSHARELYEGLIGAAVVGRVDPGCVDHWAAAEYGSLLTAQGEYTTALSQFEAAVASIETCGAPPAGKSIWSELWAVHQTLKARYHLLAGHVAWECGGELRCQRGSGAHQHLLQAAAAAENAATAAEAGSLAAQVARADAADAFGVLGYWYMTCGDDVQRAGKCFHRALALDPEQDVAGEALVDLLLAQKDTTAARALLNDCIARASAQPSAGPAGIPSGVGVASCVWVVRCLAALQVSAGEAGEAVPALQQVLRQRPLDSRLWELLGAAYHQMGRHTAALRSYARALELCPSRVYCSIQSGVLFHHQGDMTAALAAYRRALSQQPHHPAALLGAAEVLLGQSVGYAAAGAQGLAAGALEEAAGLAQMATKHHGNLQSGWKLLGDILVQHADVAPCAKQQASKEAAGGDGAVQAIASSVKAQCEYMVQARKAYAAALHLNPTQGQVWGDVAVAVHLSASLSTIPASDPTTAITSAKSLRALSWRLFQGGLKLEPTCDAMWAMAGEVAMVQGEEAAFNPAGADAPAPAGLQPHGTHATETSTSIEDLFARAEVCLTRALQLNSSRGPAWAALARLYGRRGCRPLAEIAAERCRLVDPRLVVVWEAMAALSGASAEVFGDVGYRGQMDAWEHAVGLGGGPESWLGYATGAVLGGRGSHADVFTTALRAVAQQPLLPAAHNLAGAVYEARGQYTAAVRSYQTALALHQLGLATSGTDVRVVITVAGQQQQAAVGLLQRQGQEMVVINLNLARALGRAGQVQEAVQLFRSLEVQGSIQQNVMALTAYGTLLQQCGTPADAIPKLEAALNLASTRTAASGTLDILGPLPPGTLELLWQQQLSCLLALAQAYVCSGRSRDAQASVSLHLSQLPPGHPQLSQQGQQLWVMLMVAAAADGGVEELQNLQEVAMAAQSWASRYADLDSAMAQVLSAHALHACPWQPHWRLRLAHIAATACPNSTTLARFRITPAPTPPAASDPDTAALSTLPRATTRHHAVSGVAMSGEAPPPPPLARLTQGALCPASSSSSYTEDPCGSEMRVAALLAMQPAAALQEQEIQRLVDQLVQLVHTTPCDAGLWFLLALVSLQLADTTQQEQAYHKASARAHAALAHAQHTLASKLTDMPWHAIMARLWLILSECHLHIQHPGGGVEQAKAAAIQGLRLAQEHQLPLGPAHLQLARVMMVAGDVRGTTEHTMIAAQAGDEQAALAHWQLLRGQQTTGAEALGPAADGLFTAQRLMHVMQLSDAGHLRDAHDAALTLQKEIQDAAQLSAQASAHTLLSFTAGALAKAAPPQEAKQLALENKWAAGSAIKLLASRYGPQAKATVLPGMGFSASGLAAPAEQIRRAAPTLATAATCLAAAETLLGKADKAAAAIAIAEAASQPWPQATALAVQ